MSILRHLYYRGYLKSCNYSCYYCPLAKRRPSQSNLARDKAALEKLAAWIENTPLTQPISLLIVPYGEALIHSYYWQTLAQLSKAKQIAKITVQTNLSWDTELFIQQLTEADADWHKLALWATFHPTMTTINDFVTKANQLANYLTLSAGIVGTRENLPYLAPLKNTLDERIYLWVNKMDGRNNLLIDAEKAAFSAIDPLYHLEEKHITADISQCLGGNSSFFVEGDGTLYACNRSKIPLGNLYESFPAQTIDHCHGRCDCFLAYVNRKDLPELCALGAYPPLRLSSQCKSYFVDIDGTITDSSGHLRPAVIAKIAELAVDHAIYLATALPFAIAMQKCAPLRAYLSGGVFAYGADIYDFKENFHQTTTFVYDDTWQAKKVYHYPEGVYKAILMQKPKSLSREVRLIAEHGVLSLVAANATKAAGIEQICQLHRWRWEDIVAVGNGAEDVEMLAKAALSIAPPTAVAEAKTAARLIAFIEDI